MAKILITATVQSHIAQFHKPTINMLKSMGHTVDVAAHNNLHLKKNLSLTEPDTIYEVGFSRSPFNPKNILAYKQLKKVILNGNYDVVHCNTPVGGILTRLACMKLRKKKQLKVVYEAHGLHFFKGGSKLNWLLWYPIEKLFSKITDVMILINKMDYDLVCEKFSAKTVRKIPGVGVNLAQFDATCECDLRKELGLEEDTPIVLSVGELNKNKNHKVVIKAMSEVKDKRVHYCIAGNGPLLEELKNLSKEFKVEQRVHFLGYRRDIAGILKDVDVFVLPSYREGLGMAAIEAMSCGLPLISSNRHGINDYSIENETGFKHNPDDYKGFAESIDKIIADKNLKNKLGENCKQVAQQFSLESSLNEMKNIYSEILGDKAICV